MFYPATLGTVRADRITTFLSEESANWPEISVHITATFCVYPTATYAYQTSDGP